MGDLILGWGGSRSSSRNRVVDCDLGVRIGRRYKVRVEIGAGLGRGGAGTGWVDGIRPVGLIHTWHTIIVQIKGRKHPSFASRSSRA